MQKVLDFLERYCEWLAVGLAALFLILAITQYLPVLSTPVATTIGDQTLEPGEVDPQIVEQSVTPLEERMKSLESVKLEIPPFVDRFQKSLTQPVKAPQLSAWNVWTRPVQLPKLDWNVRVDEGVLAVGDKVNALPVPPAAIIEPQPTTGFAQVSAVPAAAPGMPEQLAPVPAAPVAPGAAAAAAPTRDVTWVRVPFIISMQQMELAFNGANLPAELRKTSFLRVELVRQRSLPDSQWGPEEVVRYVDPLPQMVPMPVGGNAASNEQYRTWAEQNQLAILQPRFPTWVAGDNPDVAKPLPVDPATAALEFDPATYTGDPNKLPKEQKDAVMAIRRQRAAEEAARRREAGRGQGGGQGGGGGRGGRGGGGGGGPGDFSAPPTPPAVPADGGVIPFQIRGSGPGGVGQRPGMGGDPRVPTGDPRFPPGEFPGDTGGMPMDPGVGQPIVLAPPPTAPFIPVAGPNVEGFAYDLTGEPEATYRYRVRYLLANPIYGAGPNVASNPALLQQFALVGENPNGWSEPITIAPLTHIFLAGPPVSGASSARFVVFRWQDGKMHRSPPASYAPGDSVGGVNAGIDYRTHWTLVEVRRDTSSERPYALLMNANGELRRKDWEADSNDPKQQELNTAVNGPVDPNAPPPPPGGRPPGPGGRPPGGGMPPPVFE